MGRHLVPTWTLAGWSWWWRGGEQSGPRADDATIVGTRWGYGLRPALGGDPKHAHARLLPIAPGGTAWQISHQPIRGRLHHLRFSVELQAS